MALVENCTHFCVFCYRSDKHSINALTESTNFYLFLKLVGRFNGESDNELKKQLNLNLLEELSISQVLGCCEGCLVTVNGFCDMYHQFKCLEMQLEWKIDKLVNIIKLANRVPSRVSQVTRVLQLQKTEKGKELTGQVETVKVTVVRKFRHNFVKICRQRLAKCQPRVLMSMNNFALSNDPWQEDYVTTDLNNVSEETSDDNNSTTCHDDDDDPLNCDDFCVADAPEEQNVASIQIIQIAERNVTEKEPQPIPVLPPPSSSLIIENLFLNLPLPLNEVLSKTSLCKICKKHFISEDWLNRHIKNDHTETFPKIQKPSYLNTEAISQSCPVIDNIPPVATSSSQQRYSLRERRSTVKSLEDIDSDDNDKEYTGENSGSNTSDSEDDIKPIVKKLITKLKPKKYQLKFEYTSCKICKKRTTKKFLETHIKTWHNTTDLDDNQIKKCKKPGCSAYFVTQEQLTSHLRNKHNKILRCHFCRKTFPQKFFLRQHIRKAHGKSLRTQMACLEDEQLKAREFSCNFCTFITTSPTKLAIHETEHALPLPDEPPNSKLLRCPRCPYKYGKRMQRRYVVHHLRHHLNYLTGESSGACELCSKGKWFVENTKQHFDNHHNTDLLDDPTQIFKCDECPAYYLKSFQLHRHKNRIHPPLTCDDCEKTFKSRRTLLTHLSIHHKNYQENPKLPVPCDWPNCKKRFGTEAEVEFHKIYSHKRNPEEKKGSELCEICGKGCNSVGRLKVHMDKVHVEKSWVCSDCGKSFGRKDAFEIHLEYHKGPESWKFECKECGKKCFDKWKLEDHKRTHTKEKPFVCQFCGEKYAHRHNWRNHLKGKHMDEEGVEEIVNGKNSQRKGNYLSRKGTKKGDCVMARSGK